jgi:hypothetical protein
VGVGRVDLRTGTEEAFQSKSNNGSNDKPSIFGVARVRPVLTVKIRQPSHEFTFGVGMSSIPYPLVLTPVV